MSGTASAGDAFLGLDIGTSSIKAILIDGGQRVLGEASAALSLSRPHPLWSEQDPADWANGVQDAVAAIRQARMTSRPPTRAVVVAPWRRGWERWLSSIIPQAEMVTRNSRAATWLVLK